ncbi:MAG: hypothetical protein AB9M53_00755 [Leptothrix sp. (in: b-proteobacteria)]
MMASALWFLAGTCCGLLIAIAGIVFWIRPAVADQIERARQQQLAKPTATQVANTCTAWWFSGDGRPQRDLHRRVCGGKKK